MSESSPVSETIIHQDVKFVKQEYYDVDAMEELLKHTGVSKCNKMVLRAYKRKRVNGNCVQVVYEYGKTMKKLQKGRVHPQRSLGLQSFPSDIRGALAQKRYWNADFANSQPVILMQLCEKNGWKCDRLKEYVMNRASMLADIMEECDCDRDTAKQLCLITMFGGQIKKAPSFIKELSEELVPISQNILKQYPDVLKEVQKVKTDPSQAQSTVAHVVQDIEFQLLLAFEVVLKEHNRQMDVYIHDGGLIPKIEGETEFPTAILQDAQKKIKERMGYDITIEIKALEHSFVFNETTTVERRIVESDKQAGDLLWKELKDRLIYSKGNFYYKEDNLWVYELEVVKRAVRRYVMSSNLYRPNANGEPTVYSQNATHAQNISIVILDNAVAYRDDAWENNVFESSRGKILFTNGYYDLPNGMFVPTGSERFDNSIVFLEHIPYDYSDMYHDNQSLFERFFEIPFGKEMGEYYLLKIARAVAGDAEKKFLAGIGSSNTGKSALTSILSNALGGYFGGWNGANICYRQSTQDEAQKLRWLYLLRHKRVIVSSELQVGGMGIDGNMIKKMANGGLDPIVARQHGGNELSFKIGFLPILFAQDLDRIRPLDDAVMTRLRAIHYQKVYCDNPSNEFELQIDRELDKEVQTKKFRLSFMNLLFDTYYQWVQEGRKEDEPECVKVAVKEVVGSNLSIVDSFLEEFEITNSEDDFLPSSEIEKWLVEGKYRITMTKFGLEMRKYATIHKLENVLSKQKKIQGRGVKCWIGIRIPKEESNVVVG